MPLPFDEFPASAATFDLSTGEISYEAAGALAAGGSVEGGVLAAAAEGAVVAALAEPAIVIGAGLLAAAAADSLFKQFGGGRQVPNFTNLYSGGQNQGTTYQVTWGFTTNTGIEQEFQFVSNGPVGNVFVVPNQTGFNEYRVVAGGQERLLESAPSSSFSVAPHIISAVRIGGDPETSKRPAVAPVAPGTYAVPPPTTVMLNLPGGGTCPVTIVPYPAPSVSTQLLPGQPTMPGILIAVPEAGQTINFTPTGVRIRFREPFDSTNTSVPNQSRIPNIPMPTPYCDCPEPDISKLECLIKELQSKTLNDGYEYTVNNVPENTSGTVDILSGEPYAVCFDLTQIPTTAKKETGLSNSPDVIFSGWFAARINGKEGIRTPIHYADTCFSLASNVSGFSYCFYVGFRGTCSYITRKPKPFKSAC